MGSKKAHDELKEIFQAIGSGIVLVLIGFIVKNITITVILFIIGYTIIIVSILEIFALLINPNRSSKSTPKSKKDIFGLLPKKYEREFKTIRDAKKDEINKAKIPWIIKASNSQKSGQFKNADLEFKMAIISSPRDPDTWIYYGNFLSINSRATDKQIKKAEQMFLQAKRLDKNNARVYFGLAVVYYKKQLFEESERAFQKSLSIEPNDKQVIIGFTKLLSEQGKYQKAYTLTQRLLKLDPGNILMLKNKELLEKEIQNNELNSNNVHHDNTKINEYKSLTWMNFKSQSLLNLHGDKADNFYSMISRMSISNDLKIVWHDQRRNLHSKTASEVVPKNIFSSITHLNNSLIELVEEELFFKIIADGSFHISSRSRRTAVEDTESTKFNNPYAFRKKSEDYKYVIFSCIYHKISIIGFSYEGYDQFSDTQIEYAEKTAQQILWNPANFKLKLHIFVSSIENIIKQAVESEKRKRSKFVSRMK